jgi:hypothetical protein
VSTLAEPMLCSATRAKRLHHLALNEGVEGR